MKNEMNWNCSTAKNIEFIHYLATLGYEPIKVRGDQYWYYSPFRNEDTPSFKVNGILNRWYDFGIGRGGSIIDFGVRYFNCSVKEFLTSLSYPSPEPVVLSSPKNPGKINGIDIHCVKAIFSYGLKAYLVTRGISLSIADKYLKEVVYANGGKQFYGLGFPNNKGGWEIRSNYFKGSSSPKFYTHYDCSGSQIYVFEGFFNFLSFLQLFVAKPTDPAVDYLILNSLSFVDHSLELLTNYKSVFLLLDNDPGGDISTDRILNCIPAAIDKRELFRPYEDLNDYLISGDCQPNGPP